MISPFPKSFSKLLVKLEIKDSATRQKPSLESINKQAEKLYFDILPSAWNVKETKFPFQCYSIRAAKLCIDVLKDYETYAFLDDVEDACTRWLRMRHQNITTGRKYQNPYTAFLVFLVELCVRLKKLHRSWNKNVNCSPERRFQKLMLTCLSYCFQLPLVTNSNQTTCAVHILRKLARESDTRMDAVVNYLDAHESFELTAQVASFFKTQIYLVINNLQSFENRPLKKSLSEKSYEKLRLFFKFEQV